MFKKGLQVFVLEERVKKQSKFVEQCFGTVGVAYMVMDYMEERKYKESRDIINIVE